MKKITSFLLSLLIVANTFAQAPFSFIKNKPVDQAAFFAAVGDIPAGAQTAITTWKNSLVTAGVYNALSFAYLFPPTLTNSKGLTEYVSASVIGSYGDVVSTSPFNTMGSTCAPMKGFIVNSSISTSYIKTAVKPSQRFNPYDFAIFETTTTALGSATTNFDWGCFNSASQALTANHWYSGNAQRSQCLNNTNPGGLYAATSVTSGPAGTYFINAAPTFFELGYNATQRINSATQGGSLPSIELYLGTANNSGAPGVINGKIVSSYMGFKRGLTTAERANVVTANNQLATDLRRTAASWSQKLVIDGNSHTVYFNEKGNRCDQYAFWAKTLGTEVVNFGVSGQTTTMMLSDQASQITPSYNGAYSKNVLFVEEITNDMNVGGKTTAQALTNMTTYVTAAKLAGFKVYVKKQFCRQAPASGAGLAAYPSATQWNLAVDSINTALTANVVGADGIVGVDVTHFIARSSYASDALYNTAVSTLLAANFLDAIHLTEPGYKTEADLDYAAFSGEFTAVIKPLYGDICTNKTLPKIIDLYEPNIKIAA
jgi:hypothetical protein